MHDTIFNLKEKNTQKNKTLYDLEQDYSYYPGIEYVDDLDKPKAAWENFADYMKSLGVKVDFKQGTFTIVEKEKYFKSKYDCFKNISDNLSFESFCCASSELGQIADTIKEDFGYLIYDNKGYIFSLDTFMRHCENGDVFYLGGAFDYHW